MRNLRWTAALVLMRVAPLLAHEIGTTRVNVSFPEGRTYAIEVVTDAAALSEKLGSPGSATLPADTGGRFLKRVKLWFDDLEVTPDVAYAVEPAVTDGVPAATIRLTGQIPPHACTFAWSYGWTFATYALTFHNGKGPSTTVWLEGGQSSVPVPLTSPASLPGRLETAWRYLALGFTHIVPYGFDHVLFVLGIYLLSGRARSVLWQVSAFTVAHSITLGLSMYGLISVPPRIVEPMIAISIAYVAVENIFYSELRSWRVALVFGFGLLHGMGFAGALQELGLPRSEFFTALLTFNLGVETGQLAVIGAAFLLVGRQYSQRSWYRARIVVPASAMIACMAVYWTIERLAA